MKLLAFSVHDAKAEAYLRPYFAETRGLAVRAFSAAVNDPAHDFSKYAADYTLFCVGVFDQATGAMTCPAGVVSLGNAVTFKEAS